MLGNRGHRAAAGYAYLADDHLVAAAERIDGIIGAAMQTNGMDT